MSVQGPARSGMAPSASAAVSSRRAVGLHPATEGRRERVDRAEFSQAAHAAARGAERSIRAGLIESVRHEIERGTYLTPQRLDAAADALARAMLGG